MKKRNDEVPVSVVRNIAYTCCTTTHGAAGTRRSCWTGCGCGGGLSISNLELAMARLCALSPALRSGGSARAKNVIQCPKAASVPDRSAQLAVLPPAAVLGALGQRCSSWGKPSEGSAQFGTCKSSSTLPMPMVVPSSRRVKRPI